MVFRDFTSTVDCPRIANPCYFDRQNYSQPELGYAAQILYKHVSLIMPGIAFSPNILSHVDVDVNRVSAQSVRDALEEVFTHHPRLRSYLFDDDGSVRKHIAVIVNGEPVTDRDFLSDPVGEEDEIFLMQALSGG